MIIIVFALFAMAATPAVAHHEKSIPSQRVLSGVYPDIASREAPSPKLRTMLRTRWRWTHPKAEYHHRLFEMFDKVAVCESHSTWDVSTGNGYYGGLQMDRQFARTYDAASYARLGTPNNWSREKQIRAAIKAYAGRGLAPWPNCGHKALGYRPVR